MEITQLFPVAQELTILLPDGTPTDIKLKLVGQDSTQFRTVAKKFAKQMLNNEGKPDIDVLEAQNAELSAACIVGWSGLTENDAEVPYSPQKAQELMALPQLAFIREQVEGYVAKRTNFFRPGEKAA